MEGKARKLREQGMRKRPNKPKSLTKEEEEILWENGQLGNQNPHFLINTMWWLLTMHFYLRGRQEHHDMMVEDFSIETSASYSHDVRYRGEEVPRSFVQAIPGKTPKK